MCTIIPDQQPPVEAPLGLHEICERARQATCGYCWAMPGDECAFTSAPVSVPVVPGTPMRPVRGYHVARFSRAFRRGLVSAAEYIAVTDAAGVFTNDTIIWDTPGGAL
jgi:hypothetical protein